jgi:hypothetical protein
VTVLLLFAALVCVLELARRLPLFGAFREMQACSARTVKLLRARGSDHCKERAMRILSARLFAHSIRAGGLLLAVASPLLLVLWFGSTHEARVVGLAINAQARLWVIPLSLGYAALRWQLGRRVQPV